MLRNMTKIVFIDSDRHKVVWGDISFENGFVKVVTKENNTLYINKEHIVFMKEVPHE